MLTSVFLVAGCASDKQKPIVSSKPVHAFEKVPIKRLAEEPSPASIPPALYNVTSNSVFKQVDGTAEYIIGPGDLLSITAWKGAKFSTADVIVRPDGKISYSFLEDLKVSGLTATEVDALITKRLKEFVRLPRIDVLVKEHNSKKVALFGEISRLAGRTLTGPNIYPLKGRTTLLDLILTAGGQTEKADLSRVELNRRGKLYRINLVQALVGKKELRNVVLDNGDRVFVPKLKKLEEKKVLVLGEVEDPGLLTFKKETTLVDAIAKAGGLTRRAVQDQVHVIRGDLKNPRFFKLDLKKLLREGDLSQNLVLKDKDIVYVPKRTLYKVEEWVRAMTPILDFLLRPAMYRDAYTTGGDFLRFDTGGNISIR
jgi:protein involved in polysaccharide export with SLBB domain